MTLSVYPSVFGWQAVDSFVFIPNRSIRTYQKCEVILVSLSDTMSVGNQFGLHISFMNVFGISLADALVGKGIK